MPTPPRSLARQVLAGLWVVVCAGACAAPPAPGSGVVFTCVAPDGRRLTSDRQIPECSTREQRVLNKDGSLREVVPPQMSPQEHAEKEARDRKLELEKLAQAEAVRRDRHLVSRYPDEASHNKAREAALDTVRLALHASEKRIEELAQERKPMLQEAEFYKGKAMPVKLRQALEANEAAASAQRDTIATQQAELERVNKLYDAELARLKRLWAGATPGTLADGASSAGTKTAKP
jgi:hypothetical protein